MILALETGWTDRRIDALSSRFRAACHWVLYVRSIVGDEGLSEVTIPRNAPPEDRLAAMKVRADVGALRSTLYPDDDDG